jgi:hypothetical protein
MFSDFRQFDDQAATIPDEKDVRVVSEHDASTGNRSFSARLVCGATGQG